MRVPAVIYADEEMLQAIRSDESAKQLMNVAQLPGIRKYALAMPDIHWGYGFPIGGVAAFALDGGIVSPGGVGYDINCGCRLLTSGLRKSDLQDRIRGLVDALFLHIPTGVGSKGPLKLSPADEKKVMVKGASWVVQQGFGDADDLSRTEAGGSLPGADPDVVSDRAVKRGDRQLGTLGSGNHFLEVGVVDTIYDESTARALGLEKDQVTVLIHSGSRGFGHQICDDFLARLQQEAQKKKQVLPDRQLVYAELGSRTAREYLAAMACAANYAWANRQLLMHWAVEVFEKELGLAPREHRLRLLYDVSHNTAKIETHRVDGKEMELCVHRKGATRAFPPGHPELPPMYRTTGQPVIIPGDMGTHSYVLVGAPGSMESTFGSTCHGAGRMLSRAAAKKSAKGRSIGRELEDRGIYVRYTGRTTMAEEMPEAYKDIDRVVEVVHQAGLSRKVARLSPWGVIKG